MVIILAVVIIIVLLIGMAMLHTKLVSLEEKEKEIENSDS